MIHETHDERRLFVLVKQINRKSKMNKVLDLSQLQMSFKLKFVELSAISSMKHYILSIKEISNEYTELDKTADDQNLLQMT